MTPLREHLATTTNGERIELDLVTRQVLKNGEPLTRATTISVNSYWKKKGEFGETGSYETRTFEPTIPYVKLTLPLDARNQFNRAPIVR